MPKLLEIDLHFNRNTGDQEIVTVTPVPRAYLAKFKELPFRLSPSNANPLALRTYR
jgi:hypothetical protein